MPRKRKGDFLKEIMHFHYMTNKATPKDKPPELGAMKSIISINHSLDIITTHLVCLNHAPKYRRIFSRKYINFSLFTPKLTPLWRGSWNLQFLASLPYRCNIPNVVQIGQAVLKKKMLTQNGGRRTPTRSNILDSYFLRRILVTQENNIFIRQEGQYSYNIKFIVRRTNDHKMR